MENRNIRSYKETPGGLLSLVNPLSNSIFLLFKQGDEKNRLNMMKNNIDDAINIAR